MLAADRERLANLEADLAHKQARLDRTRRQQQQKLTAIREDRGQRREAILELESAAGELSRLVGTLDAAEPDLDMQKFRGLLDWPADGKVTAGFGTVVHPRFQTRVPHPGLDIAGASGSDIRAVFDGEVVFAAWMRGYGLTAIVDHGGGLLSIYAHASVLMVEPGQRLRRGQRLGKIGETGSLKGPFLYFELRVDGEPSDPTDWLKPRSR